jgi:hypothetical protein
VSATPGEQLFAAKDGFDVRIEKLAITNNVFAELNVRSRLFPSSLVAFKITARIATP